MKHNANQQLSNSEQSGASSSCIKESNHCKVVVIGSGKSVHILNRARALRDSGLDIIVVSDDVPTDDTCDLVVEYEPNLSRWGKLNRMSTVARRHSADVLFVHYASGLAAWSVMLVGCPYAVCLMGTDVNPHVMRRRNSFARRLTTKLVRNASLVTAKSSYLAEVARGMGADEGNVLEVLWGIDPANYNNLDGTSLRERLGIQPRDKVVFSPRALRPRYQIDLLVESSPQILRDIENLVFVISGFNQDASYHAQLKKRVTELGLRERFHFVGAISQAEMPLYYAMADATVSLSDRDGFPQSILESMAAGTPCIVGRLPELTDLVDHGKHVWFVELEADSIASGIAHILNHRSSREDLIATGLNFVRSDANIEVNAKRVASRLRQLRPGRLRPSRWRIAILIDLALDYLASRTQRKNRPNTTS